MDKNSTITAAASDYKTERAGVLKSIGQWINGLSAEKVAATAINTALVITAVGAVANVANVLGNFYMNGAAHSMGLQNWVSSLPPGGRPLVDERRLRAQ